MTESISFSLRISMKRINISNLELHRFHLLSYIGLSRRNFAAGTWKLSFPIIILTFATVFELNSTMYYILTLKRWLWQPKNEGPKRLPVERSVLQLSHVTGQFCPCVFQKKERTNTRYSLYPSAFI